MITAVVANRSTPSDRFNTANADVQGERREVTVLFLDLTNFTSFSKQIDSEEIYLIVDEAMRLLVQIIYRYEGTVDKFTGDGLMAIFGTPITHENDPERAVRAGLEMQEALKPLQLRIQDRYGFDFQARIGINTGLVIAGSLGNDLHMEYTVIGDTVNLASRLEKAAEPGTVLVSTDTYQRTRPIFQFQSLPPIPMKGITDPVHAFRPLAVRKNPGRVRGLPGIQTSMIGRSDELMALHHIWRQVVQHQRNQIVLVTGEAGLGKSRLVSEFRRELEGTAGTVAEGYCLAIARAQPFWVFASLLRDILQISELDTAEHQRDLLYTFIEQFEIPTQQVLPYLVSLLGLEQPNSAVAQRLQQLDPGMLQRQTYVALRQVLLAMARSAPLILILEDLHWVDPASKDLLIYLIQAMNEAPIMLLLISRDFERKTTIRPLLDALEKTPQRFTDLPLKHLSAAEALQLLDQLLNQNSVESPLRLLQKQIVKRSEGNPFYIEEIVRMLIDQGTLIAREGRFEMTAQAGDSIEQLPGTLNSLILTRFDGLEEDLRQILQKAAVIGRSFPLSLLQALCAGDTDKIPRYLHALKERLFLAEDPFNREPGFTFYHALIQEAIYSTLLKRDQRTLHGEVAEAIERGLFFTDDERVEALGYHYGRSHTLARAVPYLITAAENAGRRSAHETAVDGYRRALSIMGAHPQPAGDAYSRVRVGLGRTLKLKGEFNEASQVLLEAIDWLERTSEEMPAYQVNLVEALRELADVRQREGALDEAVDHLEMALALYDALQQDRDPHIRYALIDRMAWVRFRLGQLDEATQLATEAVHNLEQQESTALPLLASLYNTLGGTAYQQGKPSDAIPFVQNSLHLHDVLGYTWGKAVAHINLGVLYYVQGMWSMAAEHYRQADVIEGENGFIAERAVNLRNLGLLNLSMGNHEQARHDYETSLAISIHIGDNMGIGSCHIGLAFLAWTQSRYIDTTYHIRKAQEQADALGEDHFLQLLLLQSRVHGQSGALEPAFELANQTLQMAQTSGLSEEEVDAYRVLATLHIQTREYDQAEALLQQSIAITQQRQNPYQEGLALLELSRLYYAQSQEPQWQYNDRIHKAKDVLDRAISAFEQLGARHDLQLAQALKHGLHTPTPRRTESLSDPRGNTYQY